jgi:hypothetical protein
MHKDKLIPIPEYIQGLIFDCDGTLVDSMPLHMEAWQFVVEQFGGTFHYDFFFSKKGMKETEIVDLYNQRFGMQIPREDIVAAKHQYILQHIHNIKPIDIVADVVNFFKTRLPMSVVSGSSREIVFRELQAAGLENLFLGPIFSETLAQTAVVTIELYNTDGAQGAARGAALGAKYFTSRKEAFNGLERLKIIEPQQSQKSKYQELYQHWSSALHCILQSKG